MSAADGFPSPSVLVGDPVVPILDIPPTEDLALSDETLAAAAAIGGLEQDTPMPAEAAVPVAGEEEEKPLDVDAMTTTTTTTTTSNSFVATEDVVAVALGAGEVGEQSTAVNTTTTTEEAVTVSLAPTEEGKTPAQKEESGAAEAAAGDGSVVETNVVTTTTTVTVTETSLVSVADVPMEGTTNFGVSDMEVDPPQAVLEEATPAAPVVDEEEPGPPLKKAKSSDPQVDLDTQNVGLVAAVSATEEDTNGGEDVKPEPVQLGPKTFHSGVEMFTYFYDLLHAWVSNVDVNKYEHMVLSDLITKGHRDADSKIGAGIRSFQVRFHPGWHSRCYYLIRTDGSVDDFSYRKCVDKLMPLPENLFSPSGDLLVDRLFGSEEDKWAKKNKGKGNSSDGGGFHGGKNNRGRRGGRGDRRGGGARGGRWTR